MIKPEKMSERLTLPFPPYNLADGETFRVRVFLDHLEWDKHDKWWQLPPELLEELWLADFECETREHLE